MCANNGKYVKWYMRDQTELHYLKKEELELAKDLALKKYYGLQLEDLHHEKVAMKMYLNHHRNNTGKARKLLSETPKYRKLIEPTLLL